MFCSINLHYCFTAHLAADSAGQGVLIPRRQNQLPSHNSSQQLHAAAQEFNNCHGCSAAAFRGRVYRARWMCRGAVERALGEDGDAMVPGNCWETSWPVSPAQREQSGEGGGTSSSAVFGRWTSYTLREASTGPRDGGAGAACQSRTAQQRLCPLGGGRAQHGHGCAAPGHFCSSTCP